MATGGEGWSLSLGVWWGIPVRAHWSFFALMVIQILFSLLSYKSGKYAGLQALLYGPVLLVTVLFHELGHTGRCLAYKGVIRSIMLWPLGGLTDCSIEGGTCLQEFFVALCGPLMHIPQIFFWLAILAIAAGTGYFSEEFDIDVFDEGGADQFFARLAYQALFLNILLFAINILVPAHPFDASRLVASMSVHCGLSVAKAALMVVFAGCAVGTISLILGIVYLVKGEGPGVILLLIGLLCLYTSYTLHRTIEGDQCYNHPIFEPDCYGIKPEQPSSQPAMNARPKQKPVTKKQKQKGPPGIDIEMGTTKPSEQPQKPKGPAKKGPVKNGSPAKKAAAGAQKKNLAPTGQKKGTAPTGQKKKAAPKKKTNLSTST
jgi:hypothetical protein